MNLSPTRREASKALSFVDNERYLSPFSYSRGVLKIGQTHVVLIHLLVFTNSFCTKLRAICSALIINFDKSSILIKSDRRNFASGYYPDNIAI